MTVHSLEIYWDNIVGAWVLMCDCGGLTNDNYGLSLERLGKRADEHMAADTRVYLDDLHAQGIGSVGAAAAARAKAHLAAL